MVTQLLIISDFPVDCINPSVSLDANSAYGAYNGNNGYSLSSPKLLHFLLFLGGRIMLLEI